MAGICGVVDFDGRLSPSERRRVLKDMSAAIAHRGAIERRFFVGSEAAIAVRLPGGPDSPHAEATETEAPDTTVACILGGVLFEAPGIGGLALAGVAPGGATPDDGRMTSAHGCGQMTPTEALIAETYRKSGENFARLLNGHFAVAVWDGERRRLILARDRMGVRPLYYVVSDGLCLFASEIKALLASGLVETIVNAPAINDLLSFGYVPHPETMFKDILQVDPGGLLDVRSDSTTSKQYWRFDFNDSAHGLSEAKRVARFRGLFTDAVRKCADGLETPGAFLSGGVDSAGVCAILSSVLGAGPKAFTVGFDDERYSEIPAAETIARRLDLDWSSSILKVSDFVPLMSRLVNVFDSPFEDSSAFPSYHGAEVAANQVGVVLTGDGPDQLLGGSSRHATLLRSIQAPGWRRRTLRRSGFKHLCRMLPITAANEKTTSRIVRKLYRDSLDPGEISYEPRIAPMMVQRSLYSPGFFKLTRSVPSSRNVLPVMERARGRHPLEQYLHFDVHFYLHDCLLPKVERTCSSHSLECRMPYLERDLVDFARGLPVGDRIHGPIQKAILRRSLLGLLPDETLAPGKSGFAIPRDDWFAGELRDTITDVLTDRRSIERGYFSREGLTGILDSFFSDGVRYYSSSSGVLMALLSLELWHREYVDGA